MSNIFSLANRVVCEIMWKNMVEPDRTQMENNTMEENALCLLNEQVKNRHPHSQCCAHQRYLRERALLLRYGFQYCTVFSSAQLPFVVLQIRYVIIIIIPFICT
jgi:hypothetical protein